MKVALKRWLEERGWFLRRTAGLPVGTDLRLDFRRFGMAEPGLILDVGAHRGETANLFRQWFPFARIISFEPVRENFEALKNCVGQDDQIEPICSAVGKTKGEARISMRRDSTTWSLENSDTKSNNRFETVSVVTLDDFVRERQLDSIDLLKMDTEGHELSVIAGGQKTLSEGKIKAVLVETTIDVSSTEHIHLDVLARNLLPFGFCLVAIYDQTVWQSPTRMAYCNALFLRSR